MRHTPLRRSVSLVCAALVSLLGAAGTAAAVTPIAGPNVDVSQRVGNEAETTIATNPTDPDNVAIVSNIQFGRGLLSAASDDGGATWTTDIIGNGDELGVACCDPSLAFDDYGNLFLTYLDFKAKRVQAALSTDGGHATAS